MTDKTAQTLTSVVTSPSQLFSPELRTSTCVFSDLALAIKNANCTNIPGDYNCTCVDGYESVGFVWTDVDECALETDNCHANANCTHTDGSFECACNACDCPDSYEGVDQRDGSCECRDGYEMVNSQCK